MVEEAEASLVFPLGSRVAHPTSQVETLRDRGVWLIDILLLFLQFVGVQDLTGP
jgi:hypothetical protein